MRRVTAMILFLVALFGSIHAQDPTPESTPEAPELGDTHVDDFGIEQVYVPGGCFLMGTSDAEREYAETLEAPAWAKGRLSSEQAQHEVCLSTGYWIDKTEVTNAAFQAFVDADGYKTEQYWSEDGWIWLGRQRRDLLPLRCITNRADDAPRVCITWWEAEAYANWRGAALPTEAQWEYAARGPESLVYPWGNEWDSALANVMDSDEMMSVGSFPDSASWVSALDMAGNAMEWVADWLSQGYDAESITDPTGPESGSIKVEKGGWWGSNPVVARSAYRHFEDPPAYQDHHIGFRVVSKAD